MRNVRLYIFFTLSLFILPEYFAKAQQISLKNKKEAQKAYNQGIQSIAEDSYWVALEYFSASCIRNCLP